MRRRDRNGHNHQTSYAFPSERTALLVIDPVNDFLSPGGADWDMARTTVEKHDVVGQLRRALDGAPRTTDPGALRPMAFTADDYADEVLQQRSGINRMMFERKMFLAGSWGADFHPDLRPCDAEIVLLPHKGVDVFETDLPTHLERLGTTHLVIAGMTANLCCESTGRHAMEHGYDVTFLRDAIGADTVAAYEVATRLSYPLIGSAVLDVSEFLSAVDATSALPKKGNKVFGSDRLPIGKIRRVMEGARDRPGYLVTRRGVSRRKTFIPLDAVTKVTGGKVYVHVPRLFLAKMPWRQRPTTRGNRAKLGPSRDEVRELYGSRSPSGAPTAP